MKSHHYIILAILLILAGWIGYLLKDCGDETPPQTTYIQDTRKIDSLGLIIKSQKKDLVIYHDSTTTLKGQLAGSRERVKKVFIDSPCPEVEAVVIASDSACDAVIEAQGKELVLSGEIITTQDSLIKEGVNLRLRDSTEIISKEIQLFKAQKKIKRKNTWLAGMLGVLAGVVGVVMVK